MRARAEYGADGGLPYRWSASGQGSKVSYSEPGVIQVGKRHVGHEAPDDEGNDEGHGDANREEAIQMMAVEHRWPKRIGEVRSHR